MSGLKAAVRSSRQIAWGGQHVFHRADVIFGIPSSFRSFLTKREAGGEHGDAAAFLISPCQSVFRFFFRSPLPSFLFSIRTRIILFRMKTQRNSANVVTGYFRSPPSMKWTTQKGNIFGFVDLLYYNNMFNWDLERNVKHNEGEDLPCTPKINGFQTGLPHVDKTFRGPGKV